MLSLSNPNSNTPNLAPTEEPHTTVPSASPSVSRPPAKQHFTYSPSSPGDKSHFRSDWPSNVADNGVGNVKPKLPSGTPENDDSTLRRAVIGVSSVLALALAASCIVYIHRHPRGASASVLDKYSKDANHFGTAAHEPWGKSLASLPMSYMVLNCSLSSTSRDHRFISIFNPEGDPIPQFDPNTAGAVVIG